MARDIKLLVKDIEEATLKGAQEACVQIMNGLSKAGPAYTGRFSSAWYALPRGGTVGGARSTNKIYVYDKRNVPLARFQEGTWYYITNGMDYADEAMDLVPYVYEKFDRQAPLKKQTRGDRPEGGTRGEVAGRGSNTSTAPMDWWSRYNAAGQLDADLAQGFRRGFGTARGFGT